MISKLLGVDEGQCVESIRRAHIATERKGCKAAATNADVSLTRAINLSLLGGSVYCGHDGELLWRNCKGRGGNNRESRVVGCQRFALTHRNRRVLARVNTDDPSLTSTTDTPRHASMQNSVPTTSTTRSGVAMTSGSTIVEVAVVDLGAQGARPQFDSRGIPFTERREGRQKVVGAHTDAQVTYLA